MGKNFAITGIAGYIAPRHLEAIRHGGHKLLAALDPNDSVGILDRFFPECRFFRDSRHFERYLEGLRGSGEAVDFVSICSPNDLHVPQAEMALRLGAHAICEKPMAVDSQGLGVLREAERRYGKRVFSILQLRVHDAVLRMKEKLTHDRRTDYRVQLNYITSRGPWYSESWKGDPSRSGGLSTNIGIHLFDMLTWLFGPALDLRLDERSSLHERGHLRLERAEVDWLLSIDRGRLPRQAVEAGKSTFRSITIDGEAFEFSDGFTELHNKVYEEILAGRGFGIEDSAPSVALAEKLRSM